MIEEKNRYKIWNWTIEKQDYSISDNPTDYNNRHWYALCGVSDQYQQGRLIRSSIIERIDFECGIVETKNSIYELQNEWRDFTAFA